LVSFPGLASSAYQGIYTIGKSLFSALEYHYTGINPQTGVYTFQDINNDGVLNASDLVPIQAITQNYYGGITNSFSYKGLQLDIFLQFVKQVGKNYLTSFGLPGLYNQNQLSSLSGKVWQQSGDAASVQRYSTNVAPASNAYSNFVSSDAGYSDDSFIRLKTLQLSYRLPISLQQKAHLQNVRVFIQGQNLLTLTKYKGLDPETQSANSLPPLRTITAGLEIGL
jgi:hypothetical protein